MTAVVALLGVVLCALCIHRGRAATPVGRESSPADAEVGTAPAHVRSSAEGRGQARVLVPDVPASAPVVRAASGGRVTGRFRHPGVTTAGRDADIEGCGPAPAPSGPWARLLRSAGVDGDPRTWWRVAVGATLGSGALALLRGGPGGAVTVAAVVAGAIALALAGARGRGPRRADAGLPDLLEHAARELRGGRDLPSSLEAAARAVGGVHGHELGAAMDRVERGASLVAALRPWSEDHPRPPVRLSVAAFEVAAEAGGARARALDGIAATLRSRAVVADEARALASQSRASAAVMVALPVVIAALGSAADPRLARTLLGTPIGLGCVAVAAALDGAGAWWMQRVVQGASR